MNNPHQRRVIALGFFDGVHKGHGTLLRCVTQRAAQLNAVPAALTFDRHPASVILGRATPLLSTPDERSRLMGELYGIEDVIVAPYDREMMHTSWEDFITRFLVEIGRAHV